jgi:hypothetical protein
VRLVVDRASLAVHRRYCFYRSSYALGDPHGGFGGQLGEKPDAQRVCEPACVVLAWLRDTRWRPVQENSEGVGRCGEVLVRTSRGTRFGRERRYTWRPALVRAGLLGSVVK